MLRRSSRLASSTSTKTLAGPDASAESPNPSVAIGNYEDSPGIDSESSDEEHVRPKKRQKQSKSKKSSSHPSLQFKNVRGRRGALKDIVEIPLYILHEILMYLTPVEVLSLSRMCKALRRILMTKSAECIWRQARLNLDGFPDCPDDLNEVQFASLIFSAFCDYCNKKTKGRYFIWSIRRCCCGACITNRNGLIKFNGLSDATESHHLLPFLASISPRSKTECLQWDLQNLVCEESAVQLLKRYRDLSGDEKEAWIRQLSNERERRITHGRLCEKWLEKRNDIRAAQLDEIRQRRYDAIKRRLTELGWGKELETIRDVPDWPHVWQPKDLTDRIWQNIKDDIIARMEEYRTYLLRRDRSVAQHNRKILLEQRLRDLQQKNVGKVIWPHISALKSMAQITALMEAPTEETVEFPESLVLDLIQTWRQSCDTEIRDMIIAGSTPTSKPFVVDPLLLATTLFNCWRKCGWGPVPYPEILSHSCATLISYADDPCLWNADGKRIFFNVKAYSLAKTILEASGLDPATTKREDVQWPQFYIECHECPSPKTNGKRVFMSWNTALLHALDHDRRDEHPRMTRADLNDTELKRLQQLAFDHLELYRNIQYLCVRCKDPCVKGSRSVISRHINQEHQETSGEPVYSIDYILEALPSGFCHQPDSVLILEPGDG